MKVRFVYPDIIIRKRVIEIPDDVDIDDLDFYNKIELYNKYSVHNKANLDVCLFYCNVKNVDIKKE